MVCQKPHVPVCKYADQFAVPANRDSGNLVFCHQFVCVGNNVVGRQIKRVDYYPVFRPFNAVHLVGLFFDCHILMDYPNPTFARNRNRHPKLGYRVHSRGNQRYIQLNIVSETRVYRYISRQNVGLIGNKQHIVKSKPFLAELFLVVCVYHL